MAGNLIIPWPRAIALLIIVAGLCFLLGVMMTHWDHRGQHLDDQTWATTLDDEEVD